MVEVKKGTKIIKNEEKVKPVVQTASKKAEIKVSKPKAIKNKSGFHAVNSSKDSSDKGVTVKVSVFGVDGVSKGDMILPVEVFGAKPNKTLIAQAVRVYLANQHQGTASTKDRGEVSGSTRKIYRQKGTGRARHGALKAPIFVGGGVAMGPKPRSFSLDFPKRMKKVALISALSEKAQAGFVKIVDGEFSGKTKEVAKLIKALGMNKKSKADKVLLVIDKNENAKRGAHNIDGLEIATANTLTTYGVVVNKNVIFLKNAVEELAKRILKN